MNSSFSSIALVITALAASLSAQSFAEEAHPLPYASGQIVQGHVALGDLNNDAYPDVIVAERVTTTYTHNGTIWIGINDGLGPGTGTFTWTALTGVVLGQFFYIADLNGDGYGDLAAIHRHLPSGEDNRLRYLLSSGPVAGVVSAASFTGPPTVLPVIDRITDVGFGDLDNHPSTPDHVVFDTADGAEIYRPLPVSGGGLAWFHQQTLSTHAAIASYRHCNVADYNNDGLVDVAVDGWPHTLYLNDASMSFASSTPMLNGARTAAAGDINGDGWLDPVSASDPTQWYILARLSESTCSSTSANFDSTIQVDNGSHDHCEVQDASGDGRAEIYVLNRQTGGIEFYQPRLDGTIDPTPQVVTTGSVAFLMADFDQDGRPDLFSVDISATSPGYRMFWNDTAPLAGDAMFSASPGTTQFLYVDAQAQGTGSGSPTDPFRRISTALLYSFPGDAILVRPGYYEEPNGLQIHDRELIAVAGYEKTILERTTVELNNARLVGFTIRKGRGGCPTSDDVVTCNQSTVLANRIVGGPPGYVAGIRVIGSGASRIGSNVIYGCSVGIDATDNTNSVSIYNNTIARNDRGIDFSGGGIYVIRNNLIVDLGASQNGITHFCSASTAIVDYNLVEGAVQSVNTVQNPLCPFMQLVPGPNAVSSFGWNSAYEFAAPDLGIFRLVGVMATDQGDPTPAPPAWLGQDIEGSPRSIPQSLLWPTAAGMYPDLGADEYDYPLPHLRTQPAAGGVDFVTQGIPSVFPLEVKVFGLEPASAAIPLPRWGTHLLVDAVFLTLPGSLDPVTGESTHYVALPPGIPIGTRIHAQSIPLVFGQFTTTNPVVVTVQ